MQQKHLYYQLLLHTCHKKLHRLGANYRIEYIFFPYFFLLKTNCPTQERRTVRLVVSILILAAVVIERTYSLASLSFDSFVCHIILPFTHLGRKVIGRRVHYTSLIDESLGLVVQ